MTAKTLLGVVLACAAIALPAHAADEAKGATADKAAKKTAQQEKMKKCNADAKGKTGDERKKFMSECLRG